MHVFETILILLMAATVLSSLARKAGIPYPTLLALGGALLAFVPGGPRLELPPELILALFVAPVLLDAAYDASLRDLRRNWAAVSSLALVAVALTTLAVAVAARAVFPDLPWPAAIALGALVAPPDAVAALAVLRQVNPPYRIRSILEGESLLNDASALLIYRLAVVAAATGSFSLAGAAPMFALVFAGSVVAGWLGARLIGALSTRFTDAPSAVIFQFVTTFALWLLAERLGLSGVVTVVVAGLTVARRSITPLAARLRVPSFAIWETVTVVLNVLAFTLIGLQLGPILEGLTSADRARYLGGALVVLAVVVGVRLAWVLLHTAGSHLIHRRHGSPLGWRGATVVGWSGMRGVVTLAAAMALPAGFPYRDFIQLTAFVVVLGTLVLQGLTLRPLLALFRLPADSQLHAELQLAREAALKAGMKAVDGDESPAAHRLRDHYAEALGLSRSGADPYEASGNLLQRRMVAASREAIAELRSRSIIGDEAYRAAEAELDLLELSALPPAAA